MRRSAKSPFGGVLDKRSRMFDGPRIELKSPQKYLELRKLCVRRIDDLRRVPSMLFLKIEVKCLMVEVLGIGIKNVDDRPEKAVQRAFEVRQLPSIELQHCLSASSLI